MRSLREGVDATIAVAAAAFWATACPSAAPPRLESGGGAAAAIEAEPAPSPADDVALGGEPPDPCAGASGLVAEAGDVEMTCADAHRDCAGEVVLTVRNCTDAPVEIVRVEWEALAEESGRWEPRLTRSFDPRPLPPGEVFTDLWTERRAGRRRITVVARGPSGPLSVPPVAFELRNPALEAARRACEACDGIWGRHGMAGVEGCNCRTRDAGSPCRDSDDCEGLCVFTRFERRTDSAGQVWARPVGECSERTMIFGCHSIIRSGAASDPEVRVFPGRGLTAPYICID